MILDTSVVIAGLDEDPPDLSDLQHRVSSVTYAEIRMGIHKATAEVVKGRRIAAFTLYQSCHGAGVPFDDDVAESYGFLMGRAKGRNKTSRMHTADFMIAATAHHLGVPLVTRNPADLEVVSDLVRLITR